jgi:hypothetical protein
MFGKDNITKKEVVRLEKITKDFNYTGEGVEDTYYIGEGEFDFGCKTKRGSANSFAAEHQSRSGGGRSYSFAIENSNATVQQVALSCADFDTIAEALANGFSGINGILTDGLFGPGLTGTAQIQNKKILSFIKFIKNNPTRVVHMTISATNEQQYDQTVTVANASPFSDLGNKTILLSTSFNVHQLQTKKVEVDLLASGDVLEFNNQNVVIMGIAPAINATTPNRVIINFRIGGISNDVVKLAVKSKIAHMNIANKMAGRRG